MKTACESASQIKELCISLTYRQLYMGKGALPYERSRMLVAKFELKP